MTESWNNLSTSCISMIWNSVLDTRRAVDVRKHCRCSNLKLARGITSINRTDRTEKQVGQVVWKSTQAFVDLADLTLCADDSYNDLNLKKYECSTPTPTPTSGKICTILDFWMRPTLWMSNILWTVPHSYPCLLKWCKGAQLVNRNKYFFLHIDDKRVCFQFSLSLWEENMWTF